MHTYTGIVSGAWGKATASSGHPGGLLQLRALDFGNGPFANYSVMQVHYIHTYIHSTSEQNISYHN